MLLAAVGRAATKFDEQSFAGSVAEGLNGYTAYRSKSYITLSSPLVALEATPSKKTLSLDQDAFSEILDKIHSGHKHIRLTGLGFEGEESHSPRLNAFYTASVYRVCSSCS